MKEINENITENIRIIVEELYKGEKNFLYLREVLVKEIKTMEEVELLSKAIEANPEFNGLEILADLPNAESYLRFLRALQTKSTIVNIKIYNPYVNEEFAKIFATVLSSQENITHLRLFSNTVNSKGIGSQGAEAIADALANQSNLRSFRFQYNRIGDRGTQAFAAVIKNNPKLHTIFLDGNDIGDEGAKALADSLLRNTSIRNISLDQNRIGDEGAKAFARALAVNDKIVRIRLSNNKIGDEGAKALASMITQSATLSKVFLDGNEIGREGISAIMDSIKHNRSLVKIKFNNNREVHEDFRKALPQILKYNPLLKMVRTDLDSYRKQSSFLSMKNHCHYISCLGYLSQGKITKISNDYLSNACEYAIEVMNDLQYGHKVLENCKKILRLCAIRRLECIDEVKSKEKTPPSICNLSQKAIVYIRLLEEESKIALESYSIYNSGEAPKRKHIINGGYWAKVLLEILPTGHKEHVHCRKILRNYAQNALSYLGVGKPEAIENSALGVLPPEVREYILSFVTPGSVVPSNIVISSNLSVENIEDMILSRSKEYRRIREYDRFEARM